MASLKFTKEQINVIAKTIGSYAKEMQEALEDDELDRVDNLGQRISIEIDTLNFRLKDCDEY